MYYYVIIAGHFICRPEFRLQRHDYNNILIKYTVSGYGSLRYRDKDYVVGPNQVMIIKCFDLHEYGTYNCDSWENKWVHFYGNAADEYFNYIYTLCGPVISMSENTAIPQKMDQILEWLKSGGDHAEANISCLLVEILTEIINQIPDTLLQQQNQNDFYSVNTAIRYIESNYNQPIDLKDIAVASHYSLSHFIRTFRRIVKITPYQYLQQYRINKSKSLLISTNLSIFSIAEQVGFSNVYSFIRNFEHFESMTPSDYRR